MTLGLGKTKDRFRLSYVGGDTLLFLCGCPIFTQKYRAVSEQRDDSKVQGMKGRSGLPYSSNRLKYISSVVIADQVK